VKKVARRLATKRVRDTLKVAFVDQDTEPATKIEPAKDLTIYDLRRAKK
jgi:hypothetical protein